MYFTTPVIGGLVILGIAVLLLMTFIEVLMRWVDR